uniref:hypothetical protein n=1 Tax=Gelidibacter sp. TaxID=2018083 RepID=UPI004049E6DA
MNNKKHIDRIFQEKLKNFEAMPDDAVWENIHNTLHKDKRKRRVIPLWWQVAGVAALLALLFTVGNAVFTNDLDENNNTNSVVDTEKTHSDESNQNNNSNNSISNSNKNKTNGGSTISDTNSDKTDANNTSKDRKLSVNANETDQSVASSGTYQNTENSNKKSQNKSSQKEMIQNKISNKTSTKDALAQNPSNLPEPNQNNGVDSQLEKNKDANAIVSSTKNNTNTAITNTTSDNTSKTKEDAVLEDANAIIEKEKTIEDAIAEANNIDEEEKEKQLNRWSISPNVAPVYFNSLGEGSTIHSQFVQNGKNTEVNMSYGIGGSYAINDKLKIRAGINKVSLGYGTSDVVAFNDADGMMASNSELRNIKFNNQSQDETFVSAQSINFASAPEVFKTNLKGSLDQQFGYIEVPLEVEYSIINKKFGLNVIGGFSTLFLNENEIYSVVEGNRTLLGEASNINDMSYSANFGLGLNYHISDKLKLNLEPMFKYQINTFNNTSGDFQPYFIGVYSGFSFKF